MNKRLMRAVFFLCASLLIVGRGFAATITVTNINDSGPGSLRAAIINAASGDVITFDLPTPAVIGLTSGELYIDESLTLSGPGANKLTISVSEPDVDDGRVMEIASGKLDVTISGLTLADGKSYVRYGGGLSNSSTGAVTVRDCAILNNSATDDGNGRGGGGIYNVGNLTVTGSTISGNTVFPFPDGPEMPLGGGVWNKGTLTLSNCTISGNSAGEKGEGGGLVNVNGSMTLVACTITNNTAEFGGGGGIVNSPPGGNAQGVHLENCIVARNTGDIFTGGPDILGSVDSDGYNLIGDESDAEITPATGDQIGTAAAPIDPKLGPLQNNGGTTETHALLPASPAIDQGNAAGLSTDQRGRPRPIDDPAAPPLEGGDNSDIGAFEVQAGQPVNISTRLLVGTGDQVLDAGFIITGTEPKQVLIRGLGPSLADHSIPNFLANPVLQLNDANGVLLTNDNWMDTQKAEIEATGIPPLDDAESAIVATLAPGAYTTILSGKNSATGVGLVEVYDLDSAAQSTLGNISTRGFVGVADKVMIAGFIVSEGDGAPDQLLIRALGPSLPPADVSDPLADPTLELHDADGTLVAANNNWKDTQEAAIEATQLAPTDDRESAILQALPAGAYTAVVAGVEQTTGVALVEVYDLANGSR